MSDRVLIPLAGIGTLELTREQYESALRPIRVAPSEESAEGSRLDHLVTAKTLSAQLSLPRSCIYEYAKAKRIPSVRVGKHVRFDPIAVRSALGTTANVTVRG
jgi:excisionase family DNA binding protein